MSFFFQAHRNTDMPTVQGPSPSQYDPQSTRKKPQFGYAPFGSTQKLSRFGKAQTKASEQYAQSVNDDTMWVQDMKLNIKNQQRGLSMFKSETQRFQPKYQANPGPGQYHLGSTLATQSKSTVPVQQYANLTGSKGKAAVPSIPADNLGFKQDEHNNMTKVVGPNRAAPHPGSYQLRTTLQSKGVLAWKTQTVMKKQPEIAPGPGSYAHKLNSNKSMSCIASGPERFGKNKKLKEEKRPGPGSYDISSKAKVSHNFTTQGYFNSKTSRFQRHNMDSTMRGPGSYFQAKQKSLSVQNLKRVYHRQEPPTQKKLQKTSFFDCTNKNPGPGQYRTNYGISHQLQKALLRKTATDTIPKQKRIVFENQQQAQVPGPGSYEEQQKARKYKAKLWKQVQVINLKQPEQPGPSPMEYSNSYNTIQSKIKQMNARLTLTDEKPFNVGTERFEHYNYQIREQQPEQADASQVSVLKAPNKKVKRLVMTTVKVRVPFGLSSNKYEDKQQEYTGPHSYSGSKSWVKPSFNIKSKLQ